MRGYTRVSYSGVCACAYAEARERCRVSASIIHLYSFETGSLILPGAWLVASRRQQSSFLHPTQGWITGTWSTISRFVRGSWDLNSGPQVCTSCALITHQAISIAPYLLQEDNSLAMGVSFVFIQQHCGGSASKKMQVQPPGIAE